MNNKNTEQSGEIRINARAAHPPYATWLATGHMPFEMHGERFAVTSIPNALNDEPRWRVTHVETGAGCPNTFGETMEEALSKGKAVLAKNGSEKLKEAIAKVRAIISQASPT